MKDARDAGIRDAQDGDGLGKGGHGRRAAERSRGEGGPIAAGREAPSAGSAPLPSGRGSSGSGGDVRA